MFYSSKMTTSIYGYTAFPFKTGAKQYSELRNMNISEALNTDKHATPWQNSSWRFKAASAQHVFYSSFTLKPPFPFQSLPSPVVIEQASLQFTQTLQAQQSSSSLSLVSASPSLPFLLLWSYDFTKRQKPPTLLNKGLRKHFPCKD